MVAHPRRNGKRGATGENRKIKGDERMSRRLFRANEDTLQNREGAKAAKKYSSPSIVFFVPSCLRGSISLFCEVVFSVRFPEALIFVAPLYGLPERSVH